jgi:hypothetical protein
MVPAEVLARAESFAVARAEQAKAAVAAAPVAVLASAGGAPSALAGEPSSGLGGGRVADRSKTAAATSGRFAGAGSAGVELYDRASSLGVLQDSVNTNGFLEPALRREAETAPDGAKRENARRMLRRFDDAKKAHGEARDALLGRLDDAGFVAGFGSNGGEEFLSYMNISESLVLKGGHDWKRWDDAMASNLGRVQNDDGSWTGHHCITGRTFCTSTALLVLLADRTPVPVTAKDATKAATH